MRRAIEPSRALALEAMSASVEAPGSQGHEVIACGLVLGSGKVLSRLEGILASHAFIHTTEGETFRDVLLWAALECNLPVTTVREKELPVASIDGITSLGKLLGRRGLRIRSTRPWLRSKLWRIAIQPCADEKGSADVEWIAIIVGYFAPFVARPGSP